MGRYLCRFRRADLIHTVSAILILYYWILVALLIFFLFLIGRFYEVKFGRRSRYQLFLLPLVLLVVAAVWDAFFANDHTTHPLLDFVGAFWPDLLFLVGGLVLTGLCYSLFRTMMAGRR
jgi:hypothetical protein